MREYVPSGVIPAVLLPFHEDLSIDESSYGAHLRDVASVEGLSAITVNAHASEVASCTFDEQRRVLELSREALELPIVNGIYADGSLEAARLAKMAEQGGASALLVFPRALPAVEGDSTTPATLAPKIITGVLRDSLKFAGVAITDAMTMEGVGKGYSVEESSVLAGKAGAVVLHAAWGQYG